VPKVKAALRAIYLLALKRWKKDAETVAGLRGAGYGLRKLLRVSGCKGKALKKEKRAR
jgi:hypothetical protein